MHFSLYMICHILNDSPNFFIYYIHYLIFGSIPERSMNMFHFSFLYKTVFRKKTKVNIHRVQISFILNFLQF